MPTALPAHHIIIINLHLHCLSLPVKGYVPQTTPVEVLELSRSDDVIDVVPCRLERVHGDILLVCLAVLDIRKWTAEDVLSVRGQPHRSQCLYLHLPELPRIAPEGLITTCTISLYAPVT